jgi:MerR family mercuric resistance operon transcriptional regulator
VEKLTIGKLANSAGINLETVRYYERIGLMPEPGRTENGHRNYAAAHVRRLTFIRRARELGFAIEDIRALLELAEPGRVSCGAVQKIAARHLHNVRSKLADLVKMEQILTNTVAQCGGNRASACPVLEMLDTAQNGA